MSVNSENASRKKIGIIGSGLIGRSWAMLFAAGGYKVVMFDMDAQQLIAAKDNILVQLKDLKKLNLLRGSLDVEAQYELISCTENLADCVTGTKYVQECVPENLELKKKVFYQLDAVADEHTILASSTSSMPASSFTSEMTHRQQTIVAHPTNPPFYCPATEIVPAPYTHEWVRDTTLAIMKEIGQTPVLLKKEIIGFALNRIQYALLSECWRLIQDDAISPSDLDKVMSEGLGMRYAFMGPLQTCHLNAEGLLNYCERYGEMIHGVASTFGPTPRFDGSVLKTISSDLMERIPLEKLEERRRWRDERLSELAKLKNKFGEQINDVPS